MADESAHHTSAEGLAAVDFQAWSRRPRSFVRAELRETVAAQTSYSYPPHTYDPASCPGFVAGARDAATRGLTTVGS